MDTNEKILYKAFIIIVIILAIFIAFFIVSIVRYQQKNLAQYRKRLQAEIETLENERKRIANDLHDELGPLLAAVKLNITSVTPLTASDTEVLEKSAVHLDNIIQRLREIAVNLMPSTLIKDGLERALRQYVNAINHRKLITIKLTVQQGLELNKEREINFYRICLEIIHNAIKHSQAKNLVMEITHSKASILLLCKDDGVGMDVKNAYGKEGLGLKNIISRAESMGGESTFNSTINNGVQIAVEIPVIR